jgi:hypothetical protein
LTIKAAPGVNSEFSGLSVTFEMAPRHYFEATGHLNTADQLTLELEIARGDPRFHVRVGTHY